jgi:dTDP-4-amino-4,6-dideoxygalactose transaminase
MKVPFLDLKAHHAPIQAEINAALQEVIESGAFAGGPFVTRFEEDFAAFCRCPHAVGLGSGTEALWLTLLALGVGAGDEVITVPMTFIATAEAITFAGATPVFVDIDEETYTMDPDLLEKAITPKTKAIIPVHLFGQMAGMEPILQIAHKHGIPVIEDACQAHGAEYKGQMAGSLGIAGCFSFYPGKNLGAFGEAGAVVTSDGGLREKIELLRDHGQARKYHHEAIGWNARMDGMQAAVLQVKLKKLAEANAARRTHAQLYQSLLDREEGVILPKEANDRLHVYHIYAVRVPRRDSLMQSLAASQIQCGIHYPIPLHLQVAYSSLGLREGSFPVAEKCAREFLSLPMFPEMTAEQAARVAREVRAFFAAELSVEHQPATSGSS